jgi:type IV pilus assembly protein PilC
MAIFTYEAMNSVGQPVKGEVDANTSEDAIAKVRAMGNFPTKIKERTGKRVGQKSGASGTRGGANTRGAIQRRNVGVVSSKLLTLFTRQLSTLVDAGLPILRSLRILEAQQKPGTLRVAIRLVAEDVEAGKTLSEAMATYPKAFDRLYTNMVRAGELGGVLDVILQRLADFMERSQALKRKVVSAMIYPIAVITFAVLIVMGLMTFVVPKFKAIFEEQHGNLPVLTAMLLGFSDWILNGGWAGILAAPVAIYILVKLLKASSGGRMFVDRFKLSIPILGGVVAKTSVARFTRTLGTLLAAGVPILEALNITRETSGNSLYANALAKVHDGIREGESFAEPLRQAKIVEPMVINMIDVGEETGELDKMLNKIADTYDEETETLVAGMVSLMEPIMVITLGVIVGFIVVSLFMPMIGMIQSFQEAGPKGK